jgi:hypothetical protein
LPFNGASKDHLSVHEIPSLTRSSSFFPPLHTTHAPPVDLVEANKFCYRTVDGSDSTIKEERDALFAISGIRGNYPQTFKEYSSSDIKFVGDWEQIESLNEMETLPQEVKDANPEIATLSSVLIDVQKIPWSSKEVEREVTGVGVGGILLLDGVYYYDALVFEEEEEEDEKEGKDYDGELRGGEDSDEGFEEAACHSPPFKPMATTLRTKPVHSWMGMGLR